MEPLLVGRKVFLKSPHLDKKLLNLRVPISKEEIIINKPRFFPTSQVHLQLKP
jgi:hypothetical protein